MASRESWRETIVSRIEYLRRHRSNLQRRLVLIVGGFTSFCMIRYAFWKLYNRVKRYPDGPLGAIPFLNCFQSFAATPFAFLAHSGSTYCALTYFPLLLSNNVLISDPKVLCQLYKAEKLLDRPPFRHFRVTESPFIHINGARWESRRRLALKTVINLTNSAFVLSKVKQTISDYIEPLMDEKYANPDSSSLWVPRGVAAHIAFNNVWSAVFGVSLSLDDPFIVRYIKDAGDIIDGVSATLLLEMATNFAPLPFLNFVRWHLVSKYCASNAKLIEHWMSTHGFDVDRDRNLLSRSAGNPLPNEHDMLYIDVLAEAVKKKQMSVREAISDIQVILEAAVETTSNSSEYMFLLLAKYPAIQHMVYEELQTVMKKNNVNTFDFRILTELHVFRAFIHEGLRISCVQVMGVPHVAHRDVEIEVDGKQCVIPKGTLLHANVFYMHKYLDWNNNNQALKEENNGIHLEYWLDDENKFKMNENFVLFGVGRRDCIGRSLAMKALYAVFALMMCKYEFLHDDPTRLEIKQKMGLVLNVEPSIGIKVQKRSQ